MDKNEKWSQRKYMKLKGLTENISLKIAAPIGAGNAPMRAVSVINTNAERIYTSFLDTTKHLKKNFLLSYHKCCI